MLKVMEAVPNFSEGRDREKVRALVESIATVDVDVLDWSADPDHNRAVVTFIGEPRDVEEASVVAARFALEHIDLREHEGVHPRVGALDVLPFVPVEVVAMAEAVESAHRVGRRIAELGVPVFFYGQASTPPGRALSELRRGGFEALRDGFPPDRRPDLPPDAARPHPTAGVTCVGARGILLAWNVFVGGVELDDAKEIAARLREAGGGFRGLRALGLRLADGDRVQISMNLEDPFATSPVTVFEAIEEAVMDRGGHIEETEVIGMIPDTLVHPATGNRLLISDFGPARVLSRRVAAYVARRTSGRTETSERAE
ncbi:MAG: glutamate formimidoyltransferase [Gemmatimonadota bacterium]|jgi:glutamate formiminotransferase